MAEEREGQCRCGGIRFTVSSEPLITMACHCTGCQKMTGSAFSLSSLFTSDSFEVVAGEPVIGGIRGRTHHYFCPECMSWLFTRPEGMDDFVNVRSTMLSDVQSYRPFMETWTKEKLPWVETGAEHRFESVPQAESFRDMLAAFSERERADDHP